MSHITMCNALIQNHTNLELPKATPQYGHTASEFCVHGLAPIPFSPQQPIPPPDPGGPSVPTAIRNKGSFIILLIVGADVTCALRVSGASDVVHVPLDSSVSDFFLSPKINSPYPHHPTQFPQTHHLMLNFHSAYVHMLPSILP